MILLIANPQKVVNNLGICLFPRQWKFWSECMVSERICYSSANTVVHVMSWFGGFLEWVQKSHWLKCKHLVRKQELRLSWHRTKTALISVTHSGQVTRDKAGLIWSNRLNVQNFITSNRWMSILGIEGVI